MRIHSLLAAFVVMLGIGVAGPALAERRLALVIGNGDYAVGPLDNPTRDADLIVRSLQSAGFETTHLENLAYRDLQRAVVRFGRSLAAAGEDTVGLVYYAGHAVQANGENYLIPVDADLQDALDLEIQTLEIETLMRSLESAGNRLNMVILDACRNNPFPAMSRSGTRGLAKVDAPYGTLLAYSTAPGDVAADGTGRNSPYTAALARGIRTPGLPVEQLFKRVRVEVMERTGNQQVPWESSSLTGDFYFMDAEPIVATPVPTADETAADIEYWKSIAASSNPAEFQAYLETFPDGQFRSLAEQRIMALSASQARAQEAAAQAQAREEARATWDAVKDSGDPVMLQSMLDRYPGTIYAELAQLKIDSLSVSAELDSTEGTNLDGGAEERLFWESVQNSPNKSDYEAYLARYPDGTFAAIARNRAENGYEVQSAALPAADAPITYEGIFGRVYGGCGGLSTQGEVTVKAEVKDSQISVALYKDGLRRVSFTSTLNGGRFSSAKYINGVTHSEPFSFIGRVQDGNLSLKMVRDGCEMKGTFSARASS